MQILSGLIVSVDAFFIGVSLGLQERCRFLYLAIINAFLFVLCVFGFFVAAWLYEKITFDTDAVVGFSFIAIGLGYILNYFVAKYRGKRAENSCKTIVVAGLVMSIEAMIITMGITFVFTPYATIIIPVTVSLAHFGYSAFTFFLVRTRYVRRIPDALSHIISGAALIAYGLVALFA
jgi:putative Mn2+ efflux pump MntP